MVFLKYMWDLKLGPTLLVNINDNKYLFCICHRKPERCFNFFGMNKYLCSRCWGILFGTLIAIFLYSIGFKVSIEYAIILMIPLIVDGFSQELKIRESNNVLRFITGILFGISLNCLLG